MVAQQSVVAPDDLVELGYIGAAYGIRGWVKVTPHAQDTQALLHAKQWWLRKAEQGLRSASTPPAPWQTVAVQAAKAHSGTVVAQFDGVNDRTLAEAYKGHSVWVSRQDFPTADDGEYYWVDLIGCQATNLQGETLGKVVGLLDNGVHPILRVQAEAAGEKAEERLIPFVGHFVQTVDVAAKHITLDWGLDY